MTDLEITKLCADAMGLWIDDCCFPPSLKPSGVYNPLRDDAQAMALVKKFWLEPRYNEHYESTEGAWIVSPSYKSEPCGIDKDLNRAICECVAKMQAAKVGG